MNYFKHKTDSLRNPAMQRLIRNHGVAGYAVWFAILEDFYGKDPLNNPDPCIHASSQWIDELAETLKISTTRVREILQTMSRIGMIYPDGWEKGWKGVPLICPTGWEKRQVLTVDDISGGAA